MASKKFRRIFFWVLALLFIATAPVVIFYARGYRFNFQNGIFIYAGSITIKSNPQKIDIFLNGSPVSSKKLDLINSSYHINGVRPGEYLMEVSADGYKDWSKMVTIHSGISTEFWNIVLIKENYDHSTYETGFIEKFFISPDRNKISFVQNEESGFFIKILDVETNKEETVFFSADYRFTKEDFEKEKENIEWSPQSHKLIVPTLKDEAKHYLIVDVKNKTAIDLGDIVKTGDPDNVRWDSMKKNSIYYMSKNNLYRMNLNNNEIEPIAESISGYDISSADIYYFHLPSGIVYRINPENNKIISQVTTSPPDDMSDQSYRIIIYDENRLILINQSGSLYVFNDGEKEKYFRKLSDNVIDAHFSNDGKKILYWTNSEINVYFTREWEVQPQRQENEIKYITRFSEKISNVQWSKEYEHILFTVGNELKIIEIDHRGNRNSLSILTLATDKSNVVSDFIKDKVYFTNITDNISRLYSIDFPEKNSFLGL